MRSGEEIRKMIENRKQLYSENTIQNIVLIKALEWVLNEEAENDR